MGRARLWPRRDAEAPGRGAHTKPCQPDKEAAIPPHHTCRRPRMLWQAVGVMPGFWGGGRWGNARMGRPTQKTCSTAGPLCIIHSLFLYVRAEIPLSLPVPITQHTPGPAVVQCLVIHTGAVGERKRVKGRKAPDVPGLLCSVCGGMMRRGALGIKNPLPVILLRRGCQHTRRLDTHPHGALTSEAAYPLQSSSLQGLLLHEYSCPTLWIFAPTSFNIVPPLRLLSRGETHSYGSAPGRSASCLPRPRPRAG
jgi:hypothetical protein